MSVPKKEELLIVYTTTAVTFVGMEGRGPSGLICLECAAQVYFGTLEHPLSQPVLTSIHVPNGFVKANCSGTKLFIPEDHVDYMVLARKKDGGDLWRLYDEFMEAGGKQVDLPTFERSMQAAERAMTDTEGQAW